MADTDENDAGKGTTPGNSWWAWVVRRRRPVIAITGLVVVGLVATLVTVSALAPGPKDVVRDYLDAIRAGDTRTALEIAGAPKAGERLAFLSAEALANDWTVDAVVERHRTDDDADVDVTFRAGNISQQGRFHLIHDDDWTMEAPFLQVDLTAANLDAVELGGMRRKVERPADPSTGPVRLLVFPGVYELYPSLADRITFDPAVLIATPEENKEWTLHYTVDYTLTDAGAAAAQQAVDAHIDDCATKTDIAPAGCPFNAEGSSVVEGLTDLGDVVWTVVTRPEAHFVTDEGGDLSVVVRRPGTIRVTGTGMPREPEGSPRITFTTNCEFGFENLTVTMTMDGFTVGSGTSDSYAVSSATLCF